jgi:hypothetical protein
MTIKTKITKDIVENLSDEQIVQLVYNKAYEKYCETFGETFENTERDKILEQIFACSVLNNEVCNGGFDQFFLNNENLIETTLQGLLKINAKEYYDLLNNAIIVYTQQKAEFYDKRNPNLDKFDDKFYEINEIDIIQQNFIINNIEIFYD